MKTGEKCIETLRSINREDSKKQTICKGIMLNILKEYPIQTTRSRCLCNKTQLGIP